jgi:hypothetical protein
MSLGSGNGRGVRLGYSFDPPTKRAMTAVGAGRLDYADYVIVAYLYSCANVSKLAAGRATPRRTLAQIVEGIKCPHTHDALYRRISHLRREPERWYDYQLDGKHYVFTLYPLHPPEATETPSEACPTSEASLGPSLDRPQSPSESAITPSDLLISSERADVPSGEGYPSAPSTHPSSKHAPKPAIKPFAPSATHGPVRAAQSSQNKPSLKERTEEGDDELDVRWPDTTGLSAEEAIIACCDQLVLEGGASWVDDDSDLAAHVWEPFLPPEGSP